MILCMRVLEHNTALKLIKQDKIRSSNIVREVKQITLDKKFLARCREKNILKDKYLFIKEYYYSVLKNVDFSALLTEIGPNRIFSYPRKEIFHYAHIAAIYMGMQLGIEIKDVHSGLEELEPDQEDTNLLCDIMLADKELQPLGGTLNNYEYSRRKIKVFRKQMKRL